MAICGPMLPPLPITSKKCGLSSIEEVSVRRISATHSIRACPTWTIQGPVFSGTISRSTTSYRIYGEMMALTWCKVEKVSSPREGRPSPVSGTCPTVEIKKGDSLPSNVGNPRGGPSPWPWAIPRLKSVRPTKEAQRDHIDPLYPDFAIEYPDQLRADEFLREFDQLVRARGTPKELPQFVQLYLPTDNTGGTRFDRPAPR